MPGEAEVREHLLLMDMPLDRRDRTAPALDAELPIDRRSTPRAEHEPVFAAAFERVARRIEPRRDPADVLLEQARAFEAAGDPTRAFDALKASLLLRPLDARPVRDLERIAGGLGLRRLLASTYGEVLSARPEHPGAAAIRRRMESLFALAEADEAAEKVGLPPIPPPSRSEPAPPGAPVPWTPGPAAPAAPEVQLLAPEGAFEPGPPAVAAPPPPPTVRWELSAPAGPDVPPPLPPVLRRAPPPPPVEDAAVLDAALAALPVTPGPALAAPPRAGNSEITGSIRARVAPLWRRVLASTIDSAVILAVPVSFLALAIRGIVAGSPVDALVDVVVTHGAALGSALALVGVTGFVYLTLFGAMGGRTLGDRILGLCSVDVLSGMPPDIGHAAVRAAGAVLGTAAFLAGPLWSLFDARGQSLHDKLAGTVKVILDPAHAR